MKGEKNEIWMSQSEKCPSNVQLDGIEIISTEVYPEEKVKSDQLDANGNLISQNVISMDENVLGKETSSSSDPTLETKYFNDNWVHKFLCYTWPGRVVNFTLLMTLTYITFFFRSDPERVIIEKAFHNFPRMHLIGFAIEASMHLVILLFVYPLSRLSSSSKYYWTIGTVGSIAITLIGLYDWRGKVFNELFRFGIAIEFTRLTMKVVSFLVECNKSSETFHQTTLPKLVYFLVAPTLKYRTKYPRTPKIRVLSMIHYCWWGLIFGFLALPVFYEIMLPLVEIDLVTADFTQLSKSVFFLFICAAIAYLLAVWFAFWEIWNGGWGEILLFAERKTIAEPSEFFHYKKVIRSINPVVNEFLNDYIYKPVHKAKSSRFLALLAVFGASLTNHEIVMSYVFHQLLLVHIFWPLLVAPILLKRKPNLFLRHFRAFIIFTLLPSYLLLHIIEYFAWNSSSIPNIENESKLRIVPLSLGYLFRIIAYPNSTGSVF